jgi:hypothetical protein
VVGEPDEVDVWWLDWNDEIVTHIARHEVTKEDVEHVLTHEPRFFQNLPGRSATHIMVGRDQRGRVLYVPILLVAETGIWRVISAWESRFARRLLED